jgi:hypothetical protein
MDGRNGSSCRRTRPPGGETPRRTPGSPPPPATATGRSCNRKLEVGMWVDASRCSILFYVKNSSVADPDPNNFGNLDPHPHKKNQNSDSHPDPHQIL